MNKMSTDNELEELKAISDAAADTRDIARKAYDAYLNANIGNYDYFAASETRDAYNTAAETAVSSWNAYISKKNGTTVKENKMNAENKMSELKIAAWEAHSAEVDAAASRDAAWEVYIDASKAFNTAHDSAEKAAKTANDYEAGDYEALDYDPAG